MLLFPPFRLDLGDARLWRGKLALILKPKSFAVLHYLVAHAGRLVSKQEFLDTVWGDVHVGDAVLKTAIKDVRRVLGDRFEAPRFVATVHRRGYRFIGPVITTDPAADVRVEPPALPTAKLDHREAERRQLTVMFCDLVGSAQLAGRLDPEDLHKVMRAYHACVTAAAERFEGHVANVMGDGVLAYFGYPQAHEDGAERAVRAGLAVIEAIHEVWLVHALQVRIGIATGLVVVGDRTGCGPAQEQTAVGATHNLAMRLRGLAEPNTVVIAAGTRHLVRGLFAYVDLGAKNLEGLDEPVQAWWVIGESRAESRYEALRGRRLTPLIGRRHELGLLVDRCGLAKAGEGQVVLLAGEPGIGKSRLTQALLEQVATEPHATLRYYCSPYHTNSALHPVSEQLERAAGFMADDGADARLDKLEALISQAGGRIATMAPFLATLLSIPSDERYPPLNLTPHELKAKTFEALLAQLEGLAAGQPVLVVLEDAHWIDPTSAELFGQVIEHVKRLPVLLVITFRPHFSPPWTDRAHVSSLTLHRLGREHGAAMVARLTEGKSLPPEVLDQLLAKADGVPLFVEELTKTVLESGLLADVGDRYEVSGPLPPLAVPATLHDSLMARLDRLASVKEVAQIGAVVGREFSYQLLATLSPFDEGGLQEALSRLVGAELMFCRGVAPDATYRFKHALVGDAAYASLLRSKRQELHARIAGEMETWTTEATEAEPEILAHHLTEAGLEAKAIVYWHKAGQRAVERCANVEAIAHFEKGLALLDALPESPQRIRQEIELQAAMGVALMTTKGFAAPEVRQAYGRARELCEQVDQVPQLLNILQGLWYFHAVRGELRSGRGLGEQYFAGARRSGDPAHLMVAHHLMGGVLCWSGELGSAEEHYKRGIALSNSRQQPVHAPLFGEDLGVLCRTGGCHSLWLLGYPDQALRRSHEGLALARERAHPFMLALALVYAATLHQFRRQVGATRRFAAAAMALCREQGFSYYLAWATVLDGWALAKSGQCSVGVAQIREGIAAMDSTGARLRRPYYLGVLADALGEAGQPEEAVALVNEARAAVKMSGERWWEAELHRLKGELLLANPVRRDAEAEACLRRGTEVARALAAGSLELRAATSLARFCAEHGDRRKAHDLLAPVYAWFTEGFDTADLKDAKALLDELA